MPGLRFISRIVNNAVIIIDALSPDEFQNGVAVYDALRDGVETDSRIIMRHCVSTAEELMSLLTELESRCLQDGLRPIIQFEAHGDASGLELRRGPGREHVAWSRLVPALSRINRSSAFNLDVVMAACEGYQALREITIKRATPFQFLLAPRLVVSADLLRSFALRFYEALRISSNFLQAFNQAATVQADTFHFFLAEKFFAVAYSKMLQRQSVGGRVRQKRVEQLVSMVSNAAATTEALQSVRAEARDFARPNEGRFRILQQHFLPGGCGFELNDLVVFVQEANQAAQAGRAR